MGINSPGECEFLVSESSEASFLPPVQTSVQTSDPDVWIAMHMNMDHFPAIALNIQ